MPCVVILEFSHKILTIKSSWAQVLNDATSRNKGSRPGNRGKIFYSPNKRDKANFRMKTRYDFTHTQKACYYGFVLDSFGKLIHSHKSLGKGFFIRFFFFKDTYKEAQSCAAIKRRLRRTDRVDYSENIEKIPPFRRRQRERNKEKPSNRRQRSESAIIREKIQVKIERISNLKKGISFQNKQRDKVDIEYIAESDVDEFDELAGGSEDEMPSEMDEIENVMVEPNNDESLDDLIEIDPLAGRAPNIAAGVPPIEVDNEFSLEYCFVSDVSYLRNVDINFDIRLCIFVTGIE